MNIDAVLFDLDGTLISTAALEPLRLRRAWNEIPSQFNQTTVYPGARSLLINAAKVFRVGVVTSSPSGYARELLQYHSLDVPVLAAYHDTKTHKPDPAPLFHAAMRLDIEPSRCIYVGDEATDVEAAQRAGMQAVLFRNTRVVYPHAEGPVSISSFWHLHEILDLNPSFELKQTLKGSFYDRMIIWHLAYYQTTRVAQDSTSHNLLAFKDARQQQVQRWSESLSSTFPVALKMGSILRMLGSSETQASMHSPLDEVCERLIADHNLVDARSILRKAKTTPPLKSLKTVRERSAALKGVFEIDKNVWIKEPLIILDDVSTSGTTMAEVSRTIQATYGTLPLNYVVLACTNDTGVNSPELESYLNEPLHDAAVIKSLRMRLESGSRISIAAEPPQPAAIPLISSPTNKDIELDSSGKQTGLVPYVPFETSVALANVETQELELHGADELELYFEARRSGQAKTRLLFSIIAILSVSLAVAIIYQTIVIQHDPPTAMVETNQGSSEATVRQDNSGSVEDGIPQSPRGGIEKGNNPTSIKPGTSTEHSQKSKVNMTMDAFIERVKTESLEFRLGDKFTIQQKIAEWARDPQELSRVAKDFKKQIPELSKYSVSEIEAYIIELANTP